MSTFYALEVVDPVDYLFLCVPAILFLLHYMNPCRAELFVPIYHHLKMELLAQFPSSNDDKYLY